MSLPQPDAPTHMDAAAAQDYFMEVISPAGGDARYNQENMGNRYQPPAIELSAAPVTAPRRNVSYGND